MSNESARIASSDSTMEVDGPSILVAGRCRNASESLAKIKEVLNLIVIEFESDTWPSDDEWSERLPSWFTKSFNGRTIEQVLADDSLWDYGSWLDAMRQRGWQWFSASCSDEEWTISLSQDDAVYSIEPLVYLARQSGASSIEVVEK